MPNLRILRLVYSSAIDESDVLDWSFVNKNNLPLLLNLTVCGGHVPLERLDLPSLAVARYEVLQAVDAGHAIEQVLAQHPSVIDFWIALGLRGKMEHLSAEAWSALGRLNRIDIDSYFASTIVLDRLLFPTCTLPIPYMMYELLYDAQDGPEAGDCSRWFQAACEAHLRRVDLLDGERQQSQPQWTVRFSRGDLETYGHEVPPDNFTVSLSTQSITRVLSSASERIVIHLGRGLTTESQARSIIIKGSRTFTLFCSALKRTGNEHVLELSLILSRHDKDNLADFLRNNSAHVKLPNLRHLCLRSRPHEIVEISTIDLADLLHTRLRGWQKTGGLQLRMAGVVIFGNREHLPHSVNLDGQVYAGLPASSGTDGGEDDTDVLSSLGELLFS